MLYGKMLKNSVKRMASGLNPYFFGKCSTAVPSYTAKKPRTGGLNPYFFGKCSTATKKLIRKSILQSLNPYFFGKCSTALQKK